MTAVEKGSLLRQVGPERGQEHPLGHWDRVIMGIDPGTRVMGYGIIGVKDGRPLMVSMGTVTLARAESYYQRLRRIFERVSSLVERFLPDEMALEAPFVGKNIQTAIKLGRAQGMAMAAALTRDIPVAEYEPSLVKQRVTGAGSATKARVSDMLCATLGIDRGHLLEQLDATDALAVALTHFYESADAVDLRLQAPASPREQLREASSKKTSRAKGGSSWASFVASNPDRVVTEKR